MEKQTLIPENQKIYVTALIYLKQNEHSRFTAYRARAAAIMERHGARIERIIKPNMMVQGNLPLPDEIHFAVYDSPASLEAVKADPDYQTVVHELRDKAVEKMIIIPAKLSHFSFTREVGDKSKAYGVALMNYQHGDASAKLFENYHEQVCGIMPEFGTHFEHFLVPTAIQGDIRQPHEIHRFYFDSMEGLQQMGSDPRMLALFPLRDKSLSDLNFMIGEAI